MNVYTRINDPSPAAKAASTPRRATRPAAGILFCLVLILVATNAAAGWDLSNQREADGREIVAGTLVSASGAEQQQEQDDASDAQEDGDDSGEGYARGYWSLDFGLGGQLFPAAIIALSTLDPENIGVQRAEHTFGSPLAMASVFIRAENPGDRVTVEISSTKLIHPSRMTVTLPDADTIYEISPHLKYEYEKLLSIRQPYPEDVTAKVSINGRDVGEKSKTVIVRSVNDCFYGMVVNDGQEFQDWSEMFAAYVNEGDPIIDEILAEALRKEYVDAFIGYQGDETDVGMQMNAIWQVLKDRGVKYSSITTTSVESDTVAVQHVRLVGDSTRGAQANCADGSVLLASIFRKIGLNTYLILLPGHMMLGVANSADEDASIVPVETTMLSSADLDQAEESAIGTINEYRDDPSKITYINVNAAREAGILPLRNLYK